MRNMLPVTITYYLAFIILGLVTAAEGPALPRLREYTHSSYDQISLIFLSGASGVIIGSLIGGQLYDRLSGHRFLSLIIFSLAFFTFLIPFVDDLPILVVVFFLLGLVKGGLDVGCNTLLLWLHGYKSNPYLNGLHGFFGIGTFISPLLMALVIRQTGEINWTFWSISILCLPIAGVIYYLPSPTPTHESIIAARPRLPVGSALLILLAFAAYVGAELGYGNWIYSYAITTGIGTSITSAYLTSAFWGFFTVGRLISIWISTHFRPILILSFDLAGCIISLGAILIWPGFSNVLWITSICTGLFMSSIFPSMMTLVQERVSMTGKLAGWLLVGSGLGGMFVPWMIGQLFSPESAIIMMVIVFLAVVLNILTLYLFLITINKTGIV